jgi:hypothetical protein
MRIKGGQLLGNRNLQGSHDADARKHRRTARRRDKDQGFHRGLPFLRVVLDLRKLGDVPAGVFGRDELATARQRYRIIKPTLPAAISRWVGTILAAAQSSVSPLPRPAWPSMHHIPACRGAAVYLMAGHLSRAV